MYQSPAISCVQFPFKASRSTEVPPLGAPENKPSRLATTTAGRTSLMWCYSMRKPGCCQGLERTAWMTPKAVMIGDDDSRTCAHHCSTTTDSKNLNNRCVSLDGIWFMMYGSSCCGHSCLFVGVFAVFRLKIWYLICFETCIFIMCSLCTLNPIQQIGIANGIRHSRSATALCMLWGVLILLWSSLSFFVFPFFGVVYIASKNMISCTSQSATVRIGNQWTSQPLNQPCRELRQGVYISHLPKGCVFFGRCRDGLRLVVVG